MAARANEQQQTTSAKIASRDEQGWDTGLHLPPWVSSNERLQIEAKLDQWVRELCQVLLRKHGCCSPALPCAPILMTCSICINHRRIAR